MADHGIGENNGGPDGNPKKWDNTVAAATDGGGAFSTDELAATLPETEPAQQPANDDREADKLKIQEAGWAPQVPYNYNKYNDDEATEHSWDGGAAVYEWDGDEGEVGPEHPELERALFGTKREGTGIDFSA